MLARALIALLFAAPIAVAQDAPATDPKQPAEIKPALAEQAKLVYVVLETTAGEILLELNAEKAPISVANFLSYVDGKAYDGTIFHRVMPMFVIQGGGYDKDLTERAKTDAAAGKTDKPIKNEWQNGLKNERGTIAMAREADPDTATREFYINVQDNPKLDTPREQTGKAGYAVFGKVIKGMDVVDKIKSGETKKVSEDMQNVPVDPVVVTKTARISKEEADKRTTQRRDATPAAPGR
jgi:peptidyl-prolyl cis-trans isomerase A (cyclophilin A)